MRKNHKVLALFLCLGLISSLPTSFAYIPPTDAFAHIHTVNGTINATNYFDTVKFQGLGSVKVSRSIDNKTVYFSSTTTNGTTIHPLTCNNNYQLHQVNASGYFFCALNNGTGSALDIMHNITPAQAYVYKVNTTNIDFQWRGINFTGSSCTISNNTNLITAYCKTWQNNTGINLGIHGIGIYDSMSGSILQFLKLISVNTQLAISSNSTNIIFTVQHVITDAFKSNSITCSVGSFFSAFDNSTGIHTCTPGNSGTITGSQNIGRGLNSVGVLAKSTGSQINGRNVTGNSPITVTKTNDTDISIACSTCSTSPEATTSKNGGHANGSVGVLAAQSGNAIVGRNVTGNSPITVTKTNDTDFVIACPTCGTSSGTLTTLLNTGKGTGSKGFSGGVSGAYGNIKNMTVGRNMNIYSNTTDVKVSANNTAYARNILSNSGTSGGSGSGFYLNNTNTTMINLKTLITKTPTFVNLASNNTNININASIPASNVIDIYDQTIGDYSTPTSANGSSNTGYAKNSTASGVAEGIGTGIVVVNKVTGLKTGNIITKISFKVSTTGSGSLRAKVYQDDGVGGNPSTLLGQSATTSLVLGWHDYTMLSSFAIPASGNLWIGLEVNNGTSQLDGANTAGGCKVSHTYGTGPSPFGTCTAISVAWNIGIIYNMYPSNVIDGNTGTGWNSLAEVNPWIYVDTGSAQILSGAAMYWNSTSTTTQILIQTSTDHVTWNTKRTVNTNLLTGSAWNYIRWDLDTSTERYVRFYGNDGSSKQLSFYEIKILIPSATTLAMRHGHMPISTSDATLPISQ